MMEGTTVFFGPTSCPVCGALLVARDVRLAWHFLIAHLDVEHGVEKGGALAH